jgi:predicted DNA binding protein
MIIAEFTLDHPILRHTLDRVPGIEVMWEDSFWTPDDRMRMIVWIEVDDFEAVEAAMDEDPSVADATMLAEAGDRRLYRIDLVGEGRDTSIMPVLIEVGGVQQELTATAEGWHNRVRFPDRAAFERVHRYCRDHDIEFGFDRLYERSELFGENAPDLTEPQRATLIEAVDSGYLDIPRGASLAELGARLDVSESAASERFRRAVKRLVEGTVYR